MLDFVFFLNSVLIGVGLAMDAFSVSVADGIANPDVKPKKAAFIAFVYAFFQAVMPLTGWLCVHSLVSAFGKIQMIVPYVALLILAYLGFKMCLSGFGGKKEKTSTAVNDFKTLILQGVATSIDALSVGFTISSYDFSGALVCSLIISAVTFSMCFPALFIGRKIGEKFTDKATIVGGIILIAIGIEIFVKSFF